MTQATIPDPTAPALPRPIRRALRRVDVRLRALASARGLGTAALVASIGAAAGMAADFAATLPQPIRWAIWGAWAGSVGLVLLVAVVRPWLRKSRPIDLAAVAERSDPALGERLTGSIALLDRDSHPNGSPALIAALADDAAAHAGAFRPSDLGGGRAFGRLGLGALALALVAAPSFARPDPFRPLAIRFLVPWRDLDPVGWYALAVEPGDKVVAIGSDFKVEARVAPRFGTRPAPETATLEWTDAAGQLRRTRMTPRAAGATPDRSFEATLARLAGSTSYRVAAGPSRSRSYRVTAVEPPTIASVTARVEPPAYTKLPAGPARDPARIEVVEGSTIALTVATSSPVARVELAWPSAPPAGPRSVTLTPAGSSATATVTAEAGGPFTLTARGDRHGLDGPTETRQLAVRPDAPPTLAVKGPGARSEARPDDVLQVALAARDDFAVASAELHYEIRRANSGADSEAGKVDLKLDGLGTVVARGTGSLPLRGLALQPGDALAYRIRVADNRPAPKGPNLAWSEARALAIVASAEPMQAREDRARRESLGSRLEEIRKANQANRRETEQLRYAADAAQRNGAAWDPGRDAALAAREAEARAAADKLQLLARDFEADPTFEPLARPARQAAEVEAEAGRAQLEKARKAPGPAKRLAELRQADARLGSLANRLDELQRRFDALAKLDLDRQKLRDLASQEDALAAQAEAAGEKTRLLADQDALRKALDALLAQSPGLRAGVLAAQAEEAARLAQEARGLAERQRAESRKTSEAHQAADGPLPELAGLQRALEDDARRLALEVDEPLAENNRPRLDTESLRKAAEPIERGDLPEALRRLDEAEDGLRRLARDVEDTPLDARALARRLARRQEALANDVAPAIAEARKKDALPPDEQAALAIRLKPLGDRQEQIARLAAGIVPPEPQKGVAREAAQATDRASENLHALRPRESENLQNAARRALHQLADALADPNRRRDEARNKLNQAKQRAEEVARDVERALAETVPRPEKPDADARAAADLAEKIAPLISKERQAAADLAVLDVELRARPQRGRAAARAGRLADAIQAVKDQAPPRRPETVPQAPASGWRILGPFPAADPKHPFDPTRPVDPDAPVNGPDGKPRQWKAVPTIGNDGKVDLRQSCTREDRMAAFGSAEVVSPKRRKVTLAIGSDDTLIVWLNGKQVFEFAGTRGFSPGQDKAEVELAEGVNRLVVRCGNGDSEWGFAVNVPAPPPEGFDPALARRLRETLAAGRVDAQAALNRLEQKSQGKMPADDLAEALAAEGHQAAEALARERTKPPEDDPTPRQEAAADRKRIATALRNLPVAPEAPALLAEAVRLAVLAARPDADPKAAKLAAEAAEALARRLTDALPARALADALARAERALQTPEARADPATQADRQQAIAAELAHTPPPPAGQEPPAANHPPSPSEARAAQAVGTAAELAEGAAGADRSKPAPGPAPLLAAQAAAAEALEAMAADPALGPDLAETGRLAANPAKPGGPANPADPAPAPADPELGLGPEQAARAADLARRQRLVRERLQSAMADRVAPQQDLRRDALALGRDLAGLRDRAREVNARNQGQAASAADLAGQHAPQAMEKGAEQLAQGKRDQARDSQRQAADFLERAARDAEDLAVGLRAEGPDQAGAAGAAATAGLGQARESLREAARQLAQGQGQGQGQGQDPAAARAASPAMRQAAESLRAAARSPGSGPPAPPTAEAALDNPDPTSSPAGVAQADLSALQDIVRKKTGRKWGELPGHLRTEILQLSKGRYRDDYARLIQLYFREIAAGASKADKP